MFERFRKPPEPKSQQAMSRLEFLCGTKSGFPELEKLLNKRSGTPNSEVISEVLLVYAGQRAARLRDAIAMAHKTSNGRWLSNEPQQIRCEFDQLFVEVAALCFYIVMHRFWDEDEIDFWVEDESADAEYLESLTDALDIADSLITGQAPAMTIPSAYLYQDVRSYHTFVDGKFQPIERFIENIGRWVRPGADRATDSTASLVSGFCLKTIDEIRPEDLEKLCRLGHSCSH